MGLLSKKKDILSEKWENLSKLSGRAEIAIGVVTSTIQSLETINQEIDKQIEEIDNYISELSEQKSSYEQNLKHNTAIMCNFSKLLSTNS